MMRRTELQWFYDSIVYPAIWHSANESESFQFLTSIPQSFDIFIQETRSTNGQFIKKGISIPSTVTKSFLWFLDRGLIETPNGKYSNYFIMIYSKGLKASVLRYSESRFSLFRTLLCKYPNDCFVDVAVTSTVQKTESQPYHSLQFSHESIEYISETFPLRKLEPDNISNFGPIQGLRGEVKRKHVESSHIVNIQMYTNEKNQTVSRAESHRVTSFTTADAVANTQKYKKSVERMKNLWSSLYEISFGARFEIRVSGTCFKYIMKNEFKILVEFSKSLQYIAIPLPLSLTHKIVSLGVYDRLIRITRERHFSFDNSSPQYDSIALLVIMIKGLVSRLDSWSSSVRLRRISGIDSNIVKYGYCFVQESSFDYNSCVFRFFQQSDALTCLPETISLYNVAEHLYYCCVADIWKYLQTRRLNQIAESDWDCRTTLNQANLTAYHVHTKYVSPRGNVEKIKDLFNFNGRALSGPGYQNWDKLNFIKVCSRIVVNLSTEQCQRLPQLLLELFQLHNCDIPAFNSKAFFVWKRHKDKICLHMRRLQ